MKIEHVARIGLASRWTAEVQRQLPVRDRVLGKIVVDHQGVLSAVTIVFAHGRSAVGRQELHGRRGAGRGRDHGGVFHGPVFLKGGDGLGDRGALLADGDINTGHVLALLVEDRVNSHGCLARLPVANDQLALAPSDGEHAVDHLETGIHGLVYGLALHHARGLRLYRTRFRSDNGTLAVDRPPQGIHHASLHAVAHGALGDAPRPLDGIAFLDQLIVPEENASDVVLFQVEHHAHHVVGEFDEFVRHHVGEALHTGNSVAHLQRGARFVDVDFALEVEHLLLEKFGDLVRTNCYFIKRHCVLHRCSL